VAAGAVTAIPLLFFAGAANRIPLTGLGMLQYIAPILQLGCGVLIFREPMPPAHLAGFALVWVALTVFTVDGLRHARDKPTRRLLEAYEDGRRSPEPATMSLSGR
jgi:chloramphenicol-sensitive protein RarD